MRKLGSGILLHLTSLPSRFGVGDLGRGAYRFADFLCAAGQSLWQVLPVHPVGVCSYPSPYSGLSAFAGGSFLLSPEMLYEDGLLGKNEICDGPVFDDSCVDYRLAMRYKRRLLNIAFERFRKIEPSDEYIDFCRRNGYWLDDFAMYMALRSDFGTGWQDWPVRFRDREMSDLRAAAKGLSKKIDREKFLQYQFHRQWSMLKAYCNKRRIRIVGDIPIYVGGDSADVWANPDIFKLYKNKMPRFITGTPPDIFCKTGQLWGSPVYDWDRLKAGRYRWWFDRIGRGLDMFDMIRLDHFRALVSYWQVPARAKTADKGCYVEAGGDDFLRKLFKRFAVERFVAEDLGDITDDVREAIEKFDIACSRVAVFGFGGKLKANEHFVGNFPRNCFAYTGTHDNNTAVGWFEDEASAEEKRNLRKCAGGKVTKASVAAEMIKLVAGSKAKVAIIPMQDLLGLGSDHRMNTPGTIRNNWTWRVTGRQLNARNAERLRQLTLIR